MKFLNQIIGALVEAWGEVKVQKTRVILSLVGVVAAVAAMTTVIALGDLIVQSNREYMEAMAGRDLTLHVTASQKNTSADSEGSSAGGGVAYDALGGATSLSAETGGQVDTKASDSASQAPAFNPNEPSDPVGNAMQAVATRLQIPYWARSESGSIALQEITQIEKTLQFRGSPVTVPQWGWQQPSVKAVDPNYAVIHRLEPMEGRWIADSDADQRVTPVVINSIMWDYLGRSPIENPIILNASDGTGAQLRVVGVIKAKSAWDNPEIYVDYKAWQYIKPGSAYAAANGISSSESASGASSSSAEMLVWVSPDQADQARKVLPRALAAVLGEGWKAEVSGGESMDSGASMMNTITSVIMMIGGIVIFLGALGMLNVAIVTVRQRVREIGIRRAMGASAGRVFFAVFMESVVATFVAGIIGVAIAAIVIRVIPLESMEIYLQEQPAFPMNAAFRGVAISTVIGALCGIIPAFAAIKVKPIDAIRY